MSEYVSLPGGINNIATETFDQATGQIIKIVAQENNTRDDYVTLGVLGDTGLVEFDKVKPASGFQRIYSTLDPLNSNLFTGRWTPALTKLQQFSY